MIRKSNEDKLKRYWYSLLGSELYVYKSQHDEKHKSMHSLVGCFLKDEPEENLDQNTTLHPFNLFFPNNKGRLFYVLSLEDKKKWMSCINQVICHSNLEDFYELGVDIGKGKFGPVKEAVHK